LHKGEAVGVLGIPEVGLEEWVGRDDVSAGQILNRALASTSTSPEHMQISGKRKKRVFPRSKKEKKVVRTHLYDAKE
jgi:hypothetical protein